MGVLERAPAALKLVTPNRPTLRVMDVARMVREVPPPVPWRIEGLAIDATLIMLSGREKQGKSLITQTLAGGVATGDTVAGLVCRKGKALIVDAENGEPEIWRRVHALELPESVTVAEAKGFNLGRNLSELEVLLDEYKPNLLILDSFRSLWPGGDENDPAKAAEALEPLRDLVREKGAATILLHHLGKAEGSAYRGTTAIGSTVEGVFTLAREKDDPKGKTRRRLRCSGLRPAQEPDDRWIEVHAEAGRVFIDAAEPFGKSDEEKPSAPVQAELAPRLLGAVRAAEAKGEPIPTLAALADSIGRSSKDGTVRRLRDRLLKSGELVEISGVYRIGADLEGANPVAPPESTDSEPDNAKVPRCHHPKGAGYAGTFESAATADHAEALIIDMFDAEEVAP
jgi:hypothetical protein